MINSDHLASVTFACMSATHHVPTLVLFGLGPSVMKIEAECLIEYETDQMGVTPPPYIYI
jgi:hypothetical protein